MRLGSDDTDSAVDPEGFRRAERLFHEALDMSPALREAYIQSQTGGDGDLAACVHRLIQRDERPRTPTLVIDRAAECS